MTFNKKIAKEIAQSSFNLVIDSVLGHADYYYTLSTDVSSFECNFEEDLEIAGFTITPSKIKSINTEFDKLKNKAIKNLEKLRK